MRRRVRSRPPPEITIIKVVCEYHWNNEPNRALLKVFSFLFRTDAYRYHYISKSTCIRFLRTHQLTFPLFLPVKLHTLLACSSLYSGLLFCLFLCSEGKGKQHGSYACNREDKGNASGGSVRAHTNITSRQGQCGERDGATYQHTREKRYTGITRSSIRRRRDRRPMDDVKDDSGGVAAVRLKGFWK